MRNFLRSGNIGSDHQVKTYPQGDKGEKKTLDDDLRVFGIMIMSIFYHMNNVLLSEQDK